MRPPVPLGSLLVLSLLLGGCQRKQTPVTTEAALKALGEAETRQDEEAKPILLALQADLDLYRRLVLLEAAMAKAPAQEHAQRMAQGHRLHHERRVLVLKLDQGLARVATRPPAQRDRLCREVLAWMDQTAKGTPLDRLAFLDPLQVLRKALGPAQDPTAEGLRRELDGAILRARTLLQEVEAEYRPLIDLPSPPTQGRRPKWEAYVASLGGRTRLEAPPVAPKAPVEGAFQEETGAAFPEKVLVLTFDDGPHRAFTEPLMRLLLKEQVPAVFFQVGHSLGHVDAGGHPVLGPLAPLTRELVDAGFPIGNHSYSHAQLSRETGAPLDLEIRETDSLLQAIPGAHSHLFRFPYGARTHAQLEALRPFGLRSILWNIDSLDWADPVPASVEARVLREVRQNRRGIILFHDIHDRALALLPDLITRLRAEGYTFAGLDGSGNLVLPGSTPPTH